MKDLLKRAMNSNMKAKQLTALENAKLYLNKFSDAVSAMAELQEFHEISKELIKLSKTHPEQWRAESAPIKGFGTIVLIADESGLVAAQVIEEKE